MWNVRWAVPMNKATPIRCQGTSSFFWSSPAEAQWGKLVEVHVIQDVYVYIYIYMVIYVYNYICHIIYKYMQIPRCIMVSVFFISIIHQPAALEVSTGVTWPVQNRVPKKSSTTNGWWLGDLGAPPRSTQNAAFRTRVRHAGRHARMFMII